MNYATDESNDERQEDNEQNAVSTSSSARWYAVQVASGCEKKVKADLEQRTKARKHQH